MQGDFRHESGRVILQVIMNAAHDAMRKRGRGETLDGGDLMSVSYTHSTHMSIVSLCSSGYIRTAIVVVGLLGNVYSLPLTTATQCQEN